MIIFIVYTWPATLLAVFGTKFVVGHCLIVYPGRVCVVCSVFYMWFIVLLFMVYIVYYHTHLGNRFIFILYVIYCVGNDDIYVYGFVAAGMTTTRIHLSFALFTLLLEIKLSLFFKKNVVSWFYVCLIVLGLFILCGFCWGTSVLLFYSHIDQINCI